MPIEFRCTHCQRLLRTADNTAGKQTKCPECGQIVRIPAAAVSAAAPSSSSAAGQRAPAPPRSSAGSASGAPAAPPRSAAIDPFGAPPSAPPSAAANNPFAAGTPMASFPSANVNPYTSPSAHGMAQAGQAGAAGKGSIDVGDVMDRTWKIFTENLGQLILGMFLYFVVAMAFSFGAFMIMGIGGAIAGALTEAGNDEVGVAVMVLSMVLFGVVLFGALCWIVVGLFRWILAIARGHSSGVGLIFSGGPYMLTAMGAGLLFTLATTLGYIACILPGLFLALIFSQFMWLIIDRNSGAIDSLSQSMRLTEGNRMSLFLLALVAMGISIVGGFIPFSFLFTAPFIYLMMAVTYLRMTGQQTADMLMSRPSAMGMPPR